MRAPRGIAVVLAAGLLAPLGGCGQITGGGGSGLADAMSGVLASGPAAQHFEYGDFATWRRLGLLKADGPPVKSRWLSAIGTGAGDLFARYRAIAQITGVDIIASDRAVTIGLPPQVAIRLDGDFDADAITAKLRAAGAKPREIGGQEGLSFARDNEIDLGRDKLAQQGVLNLSQVVVSGSTVAAGGAAGSVAAALASGDSLADLPDHAAMADCLGDVVTAVIEVPRGPSAPVSLYGIGLRKPGDAADTAVGVVCALPRGDVAAVAQSMRANLDTSKPFPRTGRPLSTQISAIAHDQVDSHDRTLARATLTMRPQAPANLVERMMLTRDLPYITG